MFIPSSETVYVCASECMYVLHTCAVPRGQKRSSDSLQLELQVVVGHNVDEGKEIWAYFQELLFSSHATPTPFKVRVSLCRPWGLKLTENKGAYHRAEALYSWSSCTYLRAPTHLVYLVPPSLFSLLNTGTKTVSHFTNVQFSGLIGAFM